MSDLAGREKGLEEEFLDLPGPADEDLVLIGKLVHPQDCDDVLQVLVPLQDPLHLDGDSIVLHSHHLRAQGAGKGLQGVNRRVDPLLRYLPREHGACVEVGECRGRRRVGDVVRRYVYGLDARDGAEFRGDDPLLDLPHLRCEGRLIPRSRGHPFPSPLAWIGFKGDFRCPWCLLSPILDRYPEDGVPYP